jgi:hypothetical protein
MAYSGSFLRGRGHEDQEHRHRQRAARAEILDVLSQRYGRIEPVIEVSPP